MYLASGENGEAEQLISVTTDSLVLVEAVLTASSPHEIRNNAEARIKNNLICDSREKDHDEK